MKDETKDTLIPENAHKAGYLKAIEDYVEHNGVLRAEQVPEPWKAALDKNGAKNEGRGGET